MELRHLRYFVAVAEDLHFGRAAERLHIAQPPLSAQIRQLERELGVQLFERTKRHVELTAAGREFLREVRKALGQVRRAVEIARQADRTGAGHLVIAAVQSAFFSVLPEILRTYRKRFPGVVTTLQELSTEEQTTALLDRGIDVGFLRPPVRNTSLESLTVVQEPLIAALPEDHALAHEPRLALEALANEAFLVPVHDHGTSIYYQIIDCCQKVGFTPKIAQEVIRMQTIIGLVAAGAGIALVPESMRSWHRVGVVYVPLRERDPITVIAVAWLRLNRSQCLHPFLHVVREFC